MKKIGLGFAAAGFSSYANTARATPGKKPNIIFMVVDNMGREAVGYYDGGTIVQDREKIFFKTPRLDKLASEGVVFENCLIATPLCAPARCGWNTGRHPYRVGLNSQPNPKEPDSGLPLDEITIADILRDAEYHTALFGKWNQGYQLKYNPTYRGFDEYYGSNAGNADYYTHVYGRDKNKHFYHNLTPIDDEGYFDQLFTDKAIEYLGKRRGDPKPFYLNLTFYAPHGPYQTPPGFPATKDDLTNYQYMIEYTDRCVGRVVDEVERLGLADNTLLVFLSDQGGSYLNDFGRTLTEEGLKVICNARWKGRIPEGRRVRTPWMHLDLFAVFAGLAGAKVPQDRTMDARDVWPLFEGREMEKERTFCWSYKNENAVRVGDWKLLMKDGKVRGLYNLAADPNEKKDLAAKHPVKVEKMRKQHAKWKDECDTERSKRNA